RGDRGRDLVKHNLTATRNAKSTSSEGFGYLQGGRELAPNTLRGRLMFKRTIRLLLVSCLASRAALAAINAYGGEWNVSPAQSKPPDQVKVERLAGKKYAFELGGGSTETIVPDRTDQPGLAGTTLAVTIEGPDSWKVVRKQEGRILLTAYWKLSKDGNTLTDDFTQFGPNGSSTNVKSLFNRTAGTSGLA